jgi:hypothetical protein
MPEQLSSNRNVLIACLIPFLREIKDRTTGLETESWLNSEYGVDSQLYKELSRLISSGVRDGWAANVEVAGPLYRRSQIALPSEDTFFFGITAVLMDSTGSDGGVLRGGYHSHPYGEINLIMPLNEGAALAGPRGWCHGGWTAPAPGSGHFPEVKGGGVISLAILPAGRITFGSPPA